MKITKAEYITSAVSPAQFPTSHEPEFALAGRSNVGKSSLINKFLNRKDLARTSSQPGKTRTLNFYHINDSWYFVDLPGYGYARVSRDVKTTWGKLINDYLSTRRQLAGIILVLDFRHPPSRDDIEMYQWLEHANIPYLVVATKADKVARGQWLKHKDIIQRGLVTATAVFPVVIFSAQTGEGSGELSDWIEERIAAWRQVNLGNEARTD